MSKAITERPDDRPTPAPGEWRPARESAPSVLREDEPRVARGVGILGLFFIGLAVAAMLLRLAGFRSGWIGPGGPHSLSPAAWWPCCSMPSATRNSRSGVSTAPSD